MCTLKYARILFLLIEYFCLLCGTERHMFHQMVNFDVIFAIFCSIWHQFVLYIGPAQAKLTWHYAMVQICVYLMSMVMQRFCTRWERHLWFLPFLLSSINRVNFVKNLLLKVTVDSAYNFRHLYFILLSSDRILAVAALNFWTRWLVTLTTISFEKLGDQMLLVR